MNRFQLQLLDVSDDESERWNGLLLVDGVPAISPNGCSLNWFDLVRSLITPGSYQHFTCTCGDAGCAGLGQYNLVTHPDARMRWKMKQAVHLDVLEFDRQGALQHTLETLEEIRAFVPAADYGTDFPVLPVFFGDCVLDWCLRTLRTGKITGTPSDNRVAKAPIPAGEREFYRLAREPARLLPSVKWIRRA